jgi:S1-C subfamily serine protease
MDQLNGISHKYERRLFTLALFSWFLVPTCSAQDAVPTEILQRTFFIRGPSEAGTGFTVDCKGKVYLVTAKHVAAGLPQNGATIQVWQRESWADYKTVRTLYPESEDVDIAVFETSETVPKPYEVAMSTGASNVTMGQQVWFLGFPWGIGSRVAADSKIFANVRIPFIKRGTMSAVDATNPKAVVIFIDGFNNPGFSGGPIVFWDFSAHTYKILGVVKGYREDTAKVLVNGAHADTQLLVNSGILIAYSIEHVLETIEASQKEKPTGNTK